MDTVKPMDGGVNDGHRVWQFLFATKKDRDFDLNES